MTDEQTTETETTNTEAVEQPEASDDTKPGREAAKYRRALRETEAERDTLREQLTTLRRQAVEDASGLSKPAGLWAAGVDADALFTEAGTLDRDALRTAVTDAADQLGLTRTSTTPKPDLTQGSRGTPIKGDTWQDAFTPGR